MNLQCLSGLVAFVLLSVVAESVWAKSPPLKPGEIVLILNSPPVDHLSGKVKKAPTLPRNWRTTEEPFKIERVQGASVPERKGLQALKASGSAEFSKEQFENLVQEVKKQGSEKLLVIDLRQESHGFVNDYAVSWYGLHDAANADKSLEEIEKDESQRLQSLSKEKTVDLTQWIELQNENVTEGHTQKKSSSYIKDIKIKITPKTVSTERELVTRSGHDYFRIVAPDHQPPRDSDIDRFILKVKELHTSTKQPWIHFHCAAGQGRTTTFMSMYDMMKNAKTVKADEILLRQYLIGGLDLLKPSKNVKSDKLRSKWSDARIHFIRQFHQYALEQGPDFNLSWSDWLKSRKQK